MALCIGIKNGALCTNRGDKNTGYCKDCNPAYALLADREAAELSRKEAKKAAELKLKRAQREEIQSERLTEAILEIQDLESLRRLELMILQGLVDGSIEGRAGSSIVALLKHQQDLLTKTALERREYLSPNERQHAMQRAEDMTVNEMLTLLGDFKHGMKVLAKQARADAAAIETEVRVIEQHI